MSKFKVIHHSYGDDTVQCDSCPYEFKHKLLYYPRTKTYEHTGECPQCGTESIHEVEDWEAYDYYVEAEHDRMLDWHDEEYIEYVDEHCPLPDLTINKR